LPVYSTVFFFFFSPVLRRALGSRGDFAGSLAPCAAGGCVEEYICRDIHLLGEEHLLLGLYGLSSGLGIPGRKLAGGPGGPWRNDSGFMVVDMVGFWRRESRNSEEEKTAIVHGWYIISVTVAVLMNLGPLFFVCRPVLHSV
jgi:hypothetical protein